MLNAYEMCDHIFLVSDGRNEQLIKEHRAVFAVVAQYGVTVTLIFYGCPDGGSGGLVCISAL